MKFTSIFVLAAAARSSATLLRRGEDEVRVSPEPPEPMGDMPDMDEDGAFKTKADACQACRFQATGSCAMYNTCVCYAANTFFDNAIDASDKDNWRWACGGEGGSKYEQCFNSPEARNDAFGDHIGM